MPVHLAFDAFRTLFEKADGWRVFEEITVPDHVGNLILRNDQGQTYVASRTSRRSTRGAPIALACSLFRRSSGRLNIRVPAPALLIKFLSPAAPDAQLCKMLQNEGGILGLFAVADALGCGHMLVGRERQPRMAPRTSQTRIPGS